MLVSFQKMNEVSDGCHSDASDQDSIPETTRQMKHLKIDGKPIKETPREEE